MRRSAFNGARGAIHGRANEGMSKADRLALNLNQPNRYRGTEEASAARFPSDQFGRAQDLSHRRLIVGGGYQQQRPRIDWKLSQPGGESPLKPR